MRRIGPTPIATAIPEQERNLGVLERKASFSEKSNSRSERASRKGYFEVVKFLEEVIRDRKLILIRKRLAAITIHKGCHNWLYKPLCDDNTIGIVPRLSMKELNIK